MSRILMILSLASAAATFGCASQQSANVANSDRPVPAVAYQYQPATASALAFDPPIALGQPMPSFDRDGRAPAAFAGYEQQQTTMSYTRQRDEIRVYKRFGLARTPGLHRSNEFDHPLNHSVDPETPRRKSRIPYDPRLTSRRRNPPS